MIFNNIFKILLISLFLTSACAQAFANSQKIEDAKKFLDKFQKLSHSYDKKIIDMYSDRAKIVRIIKKSNGKTEKVTLPVKGYKKMLRYVRFFAKIKGYKNYYNDLSYEMENENVRITGKRINNDGYKAPISLLIGENSEGKMKILEEKTATKSDFIVKKIFTKMR